MVMAYESLDQLPGDIKNDLPEDAQRIFMAAFNSGSRDGLSEEGARQLAWNTIKHDYEPGSSGKWERRPQQSNSTNKSITSGGN